MSDWGHVLFYYDYESEAGKEPVRIRGYLGKSYRGVNSDMIMLHAFNGIRYFLANSRELHKEYYYCDRLGHVDLRDFETAFDVLFELGLIQTGDEFYRGDDTLGFFVASYTGNPKDGYKLKFGYERGGKLLSRQDIEDFRKKFRAGSRDEDVFDQYYGEVWKFFDEQEAVMFESTEDLTALEKQAEEFETEVEAEEEKRRAEEEKSKAEHEKWKASLPIFDSDNIEDLGLSVRSYNCLRRNGIKTVEQLSSLSDDDLGQLKYPGRACREEIKAVLEARKEYMRSKTK